MVQYGLQHLHVILSIIISVQASLQLVSYKILKGNVRKTRLPEKPGADNVTMPIHRVII